MRLAILFALAAVALSVPVELNIAEHGATFMSGGDENNVHLFDVCAQDAICGACHAADNSALLQATVDWEAGAYDLNMLAFFQCYTIFGAGCNVDNAHFRVRFRPAGVTFPAEPFPESYVNAIVPRLCDCTSCFAAPTFSAVSATLNHDFSYIEVVFSSAVELSQPGNVFELGVARSLSNILPADFLTALAANGQGWFVDATTLRIAVGANSHLDTLTGLLNGNYKLPLIAGSLHAKNYHTVVLSNQPTLMLPANPDQIAFSLPAELVINPCAGISIDLSHTPGGGGEQLVFTLDVSPALNAPGGSVTTLPQFSYGVFSDPGPASGLMTAGVVYTFTFTATAWYGATKTVKVSVSTPDSPHCQSCTNAGTCVCDDARWTGADCLEDTQACSQLQPCQNGGTCHTDLTQAPWYQCTCAGTFMGTNCDVPIPPRTGTQFTLTLNDDINKIADLNTWKAHVLAILDNAIGFNTPSQIARLLISNVQAGSIRVTFALLDPAAPFLTVDENGQHVQSNSEVINKLKQLISSHSSTLFTGELATLDSTQGIAVASCAFQLDADGNEVADLSTCGGSSPDTDKSLQIGLGVGLGVGFLFIAFVVWCIVHHRHPQKTATTTGDVEMGKQLPPVTFHVSNDNLHEVFKPRDPTQPPSNGSVTVHPAPAAAEPATTS